MNTLTARVFLLWCFLYFTPLVSAQHCPPIVESYLSATSVDRNDDGLEFSMTYSKTGGQPKLAYQAYLVAFSVESADTIAKLTPQQALAKGHAAIIETKIAQRNKRGKYESKFSLKTEAFVETLLTAKLIKKSRVNDSGGWKSYGDQIRLAVFIPFLDDEKYSVLEDLPDDTHECNYRGDSALLFEPLGPDLQICFGVVQAVQLKAGKHYIQLNGNRPTGAVAR